MLVLVGLIQRDEVLVVLRARIDLKVFCKHQEMLFGGFGGQPQLDWRTLNFLHNLACCHVGHCARRQRLSLPWHELFVSITELLHLQWHYLFKWTRRLWRPKISITTLNATFRPGLLILCILWLLFDLVGLFSLDKRRFLLLLMVFWWPQLAAFFFDRFNPWRYFRIEAVLLVSC